MMRRFLFLTACFCLPGIVHADDLHVWKDSPNPGTPYDAWTNAAHTIQDAVDHAEDGDIVWVTNGVYNTGGAAAPAYTLINRVCITNEITLQSVNGAEFTSIVGSGPRGAGATRCVYLSANATISGFTLTNGHTLVTGGSEDKRGGGVYLGPGSSLSNCVIQNCSAEWTGGGVHGAGQGRVIDCVVKANEGVAAGGGLYMGLRTNAVRNCLIVGNQTGNGNGGGGVYCFDITIIESCTIAGNHSDWRSGGCDVGQSGCTIRNSIIYDNEADVMDDNWGWDTNKLWAENCYSVPVLPGTNNSVADPSFAADDGSNFRLRYSSPCRNTGTNQAWMSDAQGIDGNDRIIDDVVDIGAYEFKLGPLDCAIAATPRRGAQPLVASFHGEAAGTNASAVFYQWDFENDGSWDAWGTNAAQVTNTYESPGYWSVAMAVSNGIGETAMVTRTDYIFVSPSNLYVSRSGSHALPFTNWTTAATNIQDAVDAGAAGSIVYVTDGTYVVTTPVDISEGLCLRGFNGRSVTIIDGNNSTRCVELDHPGAILEELTITRGSKSDGAGVYCKEGTVRDCLLVDNNTTPTFGDDEGGGLYCVSGTVAGCTFTGNHASDHGGGTYIEQQALVTNCTFLSNDSGYGGGLYIDGHATILASSFTGNRTTWRDGGGLYCQGEAQLEDVTFSNNSADRNGGGASFRSNAIVRDCTFTGNTATNSTGGGLHGGGPPTIYVYSSGFNNNVSKSGGGGIYAQSVFVHDCTMTQNRTEGSGGGLYAINGDISNSTFNANHADSGGGLRLQGGSILDCDIVGNTTTGSHNSSGAGCDVHSAWISGCTISHNTAQGPGGGIYTIGPSLISNSTISGNAASDGGAIRCGQTTTVTQCIMEYNTATDGDGGGIMAENGALIDACIVRDNVSTSSFHTYAGGLYLKGGSVCRNSLVYDNTINSGAGAYGGGVYGGSGSTIDNCTVVGNIANKGSIPVYEAEGGGIYAGANVIIRNCIIYYNTANVDPNIDIAYGDTTFSCSTPTPTGSGNIPGPPQFAGYGSRDLTLQNSSPCIDAGTPSGATRDYNRIPRPLDGNAVAGSQWDMGAYEYVHVTADSDGDGLSDTNELDGTGTDPREADTDGDHASDYEEMIADTDGTETNSYFRIMDTTHTNSHTVTFSCTNSRKYSLMYSENLVTGEWSLVTGQTLIPGTGSSMSLTDPAGTENRNYTVGVSLP